jgi:hypothetical protein
MYLFLRGIDFASFYDFSIEFWKYFYSVIFSVFRFISNILRLTYYTKVGGNRHMYKFGQCKIVFINMWKELLVCQSIFRTISDWCCSISIVRVRIPSRDNKTIVQNLIITVGFNFRGIYRYKFLYALLKECLDGGGGGKGGSSRFVLTR